MISIYKTIEDDMVVLDKIEEGCWISAIHPNEEELSFLQEETGIDLDDLRAPLDDEERSRIELEDGYNMILVDIPSLDEKDRYVTIPLGIYMTKEHIITICLEESPVLKAFVNRTRVLHIQKDSLCIPDFVSQCCFLPALSAYY